MWLAAIGVFVRMTRATSRASTAAFWIGAVLLTFIWYDNIAGLPHGDRPDPIASLIVFVIFIAWMYWMNRARPLRAAPSRG